MSVKKSKRTRRLRPPSKSVRNQADRIYEHTVRAEVVAGDLIRRFASRIEDEHARGILFLDYKMIARALVTGDPETKSTNDHDPPEHGMWERYAYHFQNQNKRRKFFAEIGLIAKRYLGDILFCHAYPAVHRSKMAIPELFWDETLLPRRTAPHVLRQWINDSAGTRKFLTALFQHFADIHRKGSMTRRTIIAANVAYKIGWKPQKNTEILTETGDIQIGRPGCDAEEKLAFNRQASTVGRSIRRMRKADEEQWAKSNAEERDQRMADRAAVKRARLLKTARAMVINCLVRRMPRTGLLRSKRLSRRAAS
jgi:hypothetical protein